MPIFTVVLEIYDGGQLPFLLPPGPAERLLFFGAYCIVRAKLKENIQCVYSGGTEASTIEWSEDMCVECDGTIQCFDRPPHDEAFCSDCPSHIPNRCACNIKNSMICHGYGQVCCAADGKYSFGR